MATAHQPAARKVSRLKLPAWGEINLNGGPGGCPLMISPNHQHIIVTEDGAEHELPIGTKTVYLQNRNCGDFYCLIAASKQVCATGDTPETAFLGALAKAA